MTSLIWPFIRPFIPHMAAALVAFFIGMQIEHTLEASARSRLQGQIIDLEQSRADSNARALIAVTSLAEAAKDQLITEREQSQANLESLDAFLQGIAGSDLCRPDPRDIDRLRQFREDLDANSSDSSGGR